jgi:ketosteroid isomerase-like protein
MKRLPVKSIVIGLLSLLCFGAYAQPNLEMRTLVAQMNTDMIEMAKSNRFEAMSKYYDKDAISLPNYRIMEKGYALILNNNQGRQKGGYKIIDGKKTTSDLIVGLDMMVDIGTYSLTVTFPGVGEPKTDMGKYMNVWKKDREDNWRIVAETWNADKSPCGPPTPKPGQPSGTSSKANSGTQPGTQPAAQPGTAPKPATGDGKK